MTIGKIEREAHDGQSDPNPIAQMGPEDLRMLATLTRQLMRPRTASKQQMSGMRIQIQTISRLGLRAWEETVAMI